MTARVAWISLTPVKALALHHVDEIEVREDGLHGDRRFFLVDEAGKLASNKGRRRSRLEPVHADYDEETRELTLRFPDGGELSAVAEPGELVETTFYGGSKPARRVAGPWDEALSELVEEPLRLVVPEHAAVDRGRSGATTILAAASLGALAGELGVDAVDRRRFRMNFGVEGVEAHEEDAWLGRRLRVGEAVVVPQGNVGRCAITTQNPDTGKADLDTLKAIQGYRGHLETTEPIPFGIHAAVAEPGRVRVGDPVALDY